MVDLFDLYEGREMDGWMDGKVCDCVEKEEIGDACPTV